MVSDHVARAAKRAGLGTSGVHRLRHSFCSHLAMRGAPARAIQELAGHQDLITTQRYRHLSPAAIEGAIRLLDRQGPAEAGTLRTIRERAISVWSWRYIGDSGRVIRYLQSLR